MESSKIKVVQVLGRMMAGGAESTVLNHCELLDLDKVSLSFIVQDDSVYIPYERIRKMNGKIYVIPSYKKLAAYLSACRRVFTEIQPDIVHANMNALSCLSLKVAKDCGVPVRIAHSHSTASKGEGIKNLAKNMLRPFSRRYPTHLLACSEAAGRWLFGDDAVDSGMVHILRNAIDLEKFRFSEDRRAKIRTSLGIPIGHVVIGQVGRLAFQKNQLFTLRVLQQLIREGEHDICLLLIGEGDDQLMLKQKVAEFGLERYVRFLGIRNDVSDILQGIDVMMFPSRYEGLGMVAVEAQVAGCPVLASDNVPNEAMIAQDLFARMSLRDELTKWSGNVRRLVEDNANSRKSREVEARACGYDIRESSRQLQSLYMRFMKEVS